MKNVRRNKIKDLNALKKVCSPTTAINVEIITIARTIVSRVNFEI